MANPSALPLQSISFTLEHLPLVQRFCCCADPRDEKPWEKDVNDWIKAAPGNAGALDAIAHGRAEVWLYLDMADTLIGYGSLGFEEIQLRDGTTQRIGVIPFFGVQTEYQGVPKVPKEDRFSRRIFGSLIQEAKRRATYQDLFLYVDPRNEAAIGFYKAIYGFEAWDLELDDGRPWLLMRREL